MATTIRVCNDTITIGKAFVSGKDRVTINGAVVWEGKGVPDRPQKIAIAEREYVLATVAGKKLARAEVVATHVQVYESGALIHDAFYDPSGKPVKDVAEAQSLAAVQVCMMVGMAVGLAAAMGALAAIGFALSGATACGIVGAVGGAAGAGLGYALGTALFKKRS